jgi:hypothetical protein
MFSFLNIFLVNCKQEHQVSTKKRMILKYAPRQFDTFELLVLKYQFVEVKREKKYEIKIITNMIPPTFTKIRQLVFQ